MDLSATDPGDITSTHISDWQYVSEGGATIVFSYRGPFHPLFSGTVLRLRKTALSRSSSEERSKYEHLEAEPDDPSIGFQHMVTSKLIPLESLPRLETVLVDRAWLEALRNSSEHERPSERRLKDCIDLRRRKGVLATDLIGGEGWTVEIKPKWGFLPNLTHLSAETRFAKCRCCRFCMYAHYRALKGEGVSHGYCPLDLFSVNSERTSHALRCLWKAWVLSGGTINNLKIFAHGKLVDPRNQLRFLSNDIDVPSDAGEDEVRLMEAFVAALLPLLTKTPLLRTLARLQRTLDPLDIEGLFALHETLRTTSPDVIPPLEQAFPDPDLGDWERFVESYLDPGFQLALDHKMPDPARLRYYTMAYLLSATFKDCSLMLRLSRSAGTQDTITVIDLDPKSMSRLKKWVQLDRDISTSFVDDSPRYCHDSRS
ncbi:inositol-pentakisphosphate 2-kinase [Phellopilus nigrolimitatus]|nr:inositol-pentakisphosphate 2-kinase [Phellopilus nigrolimitatus]